MVLIKASKGPDPKIVHDQLETLQGLWKSWGPEAFLRYTVWIQTKKPTEASLKRKQFSRLVPFSYNPIQRDIESRLGNRNIYLKPRQVGLTTWVLLRRLFVPCILNPGSNSFLISQSSSKATEHFRIIQRARRFFALSDPANGEKNGWNQSLLDNLLHAKYSNRKELIFDQIDSSCTIGSAEVEEAGQGSCLDPESWVLTSKYKVVKLKEIKVGDWLIDEYGEPVQVTKTFVIPANEQPYKGKAIEFTLKYRGGNTSTIKAAPNHPFLTQRGEVEAQHITDEDFIAYPKRKLSETKQSIAFQKNYGNKVNRTTARIHKCSGKDTLTLDRDFGLVCGYYLGDGVGVSNRRVGFIIKAPRKKAVVFNRINKFLKANNLGELSQGASSRKSNWGVNNAAFARFIRSNFGYSASKHVANWWNKAPKEFLRGLLEGWLLADGYFPGKFSKKKGKDPCNRGCRIIQGYGKNARIVFAMRDIAVALGVGMPGLSLHNKPDSKIIIQGRECNNKGRKYVLHFSDQAFEGLGQVFDWIKPIGQVRGRKTNKQFQDDNFVYVKVAKVKKILLNEFRDLTVKSKRHLYCLVQGVTHNTLHHVACSEIARWPGIPEETLANLKEALIIDGTLDLESTANGAGGYFYDECMRAERNDSEFVFHFHPWWWEPNYRVNLSAVQAAEMENDLSAQEQALRAKFNLDLEQLAFRRMKSKSLRHNFAEKYPEDPLSAFLASGSQFFDAQVLQLRMLELHGVKPLWSFGNGEYREFSVPIPGRRYIIGADPASGKMVGSASDSDVFKTDYSAAKVIDLETGEEVAAYMARCSTVSFALDLERIGKRWNTAVIAVERGGGPEAAEGGTVILTLVDNSYPMIYKHKEWWRRNRKQKEEIFLEGFPTNTRTRPIALNRLKQFVDEMPALIHDVELIKQCMVFVRDEKGRPAAQPGAHDDAVLAAAIAHCVRLILLGYIDPLKMSTESYGQFDGDEEEAA